MIHWGRHKGGCSAALALLVLCILAFAASASARDLPSSIASAEARAVSGHEEVAQLKGRLAPALARLRVAAQMAAPEREELRAAKQHAASIQRRQQARRGAALVQLHRIEEANRKSTEKHEEKVTSGIGIGLAVLIVAAIALGWGWFRAGAAVAALTRLTLSRAIGVCVGAGLLAVIVGAVLSGSSGIAAALGWAVIFLGLMLPVAFLLARHSAEIQRGRSKPVLRRERLPARVVQVLAGVLGALCLLAFGSALFAPAAKSDDVPATVRAQAADRAADFPPLTAARQRAKQLEVKAAPFFSRLRDAKEAARKAKRSLGHAEGRAAAAEDQTRKFTHRLLALEAREAREAEADQRREERALLAEERREEKERAAEERVAEREAEEFEEAEACDPNYRGACLHDGIGDYDCAGGDGNGPNYVEGPIEVVGADPFGLDADGDGIACEDG
jgi:hypothetical protein